MVRWRAAASQNGLIWRQGRYFLLMIAKRAIGERHAPDTNKGEFTITAVVSDIQAKFAHNQGCQLVRCPCR